MPETKARASAKARSKRSGDEPHAVPPAATATEEGRAPVCTVAFCPICAAVTAAQGAAPEAVEHLLNAAREFFLAARAVIDARADHLAGTASEPSRTLEKIDIA